MTRWRAAFLIVLFSSPVPGRLLAGLTWEQQTLTFRPAIGDTATVAHFKFQNTGNSSVTLKTVTASCSCTQASAAKKSYAPGETGEITATFSFEDRVGTQTQEIYVETDDPAQPPIRLTLATTIPTPAKVEPDPLRWLPGEPLQPKRARVIVANGVTLRLTAAKPSAPGISAQIEAGTTKGVFEIVVTPDGSHQPFLGFLRIETDFPKEHPKAVLLHVQIAR